MSHVQAAGEFTLAVCLRRSSLGRKVSCSVLRAPNTVRALGSGSECRPSTRHKSVNYIVISRLDPTEIFSSPCKHTPKFPESGTEHSSWKTGAASRGKQVFNRRKKKKKWRVNIQQFYEWFVQLSILKDLNLHAFQQVNVCLQDMVLNMVLILWLLCFFHGFTF